MTSRSLALVAILSLTQACLPGDDDAFIRIEGIEAGATVSGSVPIGIPRSTPFGYRQWHLAFDDNDIDAGKMKEGPPPGVLHTSTLTNGSHRLRVEMRAWGWRTWRDSVEFLVDNPPQRLLRQESESEPKIGETFRSVLEFNLPHLRLEPRALSLPGVPLSAIKLRALEGSRYSVEFDIPNDDDLFRVYYLDLAAIDADGRELVFQVEIVLDRSE